MIFARKKITKFSNFTWYLPQKPEFYMIIAWKYFPVFLGGRGGTCHPRLVRLCNYSLQFSLNQANRTMLVCSVTAVNLWDWCRCYCGIISLQAGCTAGCISCHAAQSTASKRWKMTLLLPDSDWRQHAAIMLPWWSATRNGGIPVGLPKLPCGFKGQDSPPVTTTELFTGQVTRHLANSIQAQVYS